MAVPAVAPSRAHSRRTAKGSIPHRYFQHGQHRVRLSSPRPGCFPRPRPYRDGCRGDVCACVSMAALIYILQRSSFPARAGQRLPQPRLWTPLRHPGLPSQSQSIISIRHLIHASPSSSHASKGRVRERRKKGTRKGKRRVAIALPPHRNRRRRAQIQLFFPLLVGTWRLPFQTHKTTSRSPGSLKARHRGSETASQHLLYSPT